MSTQIRNRSFLIAPSNKGTINNSLTDLKRDLSGIKFNNHSLKEILIKKLNISPEKIKNEILNEGLEELEVNELDKLVSEKIIETIKNQLNENLLQELFKEQLLFFTKDDQKIQMFIKQLTKVFYQYGLIYAGSQSISKTINDKDDDFFLQGTDLVTEVNIYTKNNIIYVEEKAKVNKITNPSKMTNIQNTDSSPLIEINNRFRLKSDSNTGMISYKHTDLTIKYNNTEVENMYDKRDLFTKIKDTLKKIFRMNSIKVKDEPSIFSNKRNTNKFSIANSSMFKKPVSRNSDDSEPSRDFNNN